MILWPAIIHYEGDDELLYVSNENEWINDDELVGYIYNDIDRLIDSLGNSFSLPYNKEKKVTEFKQYDSNISLYDFNKLILKHLSVLNQCCISKITISSYQEGILLVGKTIE